MEGGKIVEKRVVFNEERCKGCELCTTVCPKNIVVMADRINRQGFRPATVIKQDDCISCANCAKMCPDLVITVFKPEKIK